MRLVIADTGPVNYLILIGHIDLLPGLFEKVILPRAVHDELTSGKAPVAVQQWTFRQVPLTAHRCKTSTPTRERPSG